MKKKLKIITLAIVSVIIISCSDFNLVREFNFTSRNLKDEGGASKIEKYNVPRSYISLEDLLIDKKPVGSKIVELYRDELQEKSERKYLEAVKYYLNGDLKISRIIFDNLLENLEYFYTDTRVSDSLMLTNFKKEFDDAKLNGNKIDIFDLYETLYSANNTIDEELNGDIDTELKVETKSNKSIQVEQNNSTYLYVKKETAKILSSLGLRSGNKEFVKEVYDSYNAYLGDRLNISEIFVRSQKYKKFISEILAKEKINRLFFYVPAVMTSYYNGRNNGGIWRLENTKSYRKIRNDVGASTAVVVKKIKKHLKKHNAGWVISEIVKERNYSFDNDFTGKDIYNSDFVDFIAQAIIFENSDRHGIKDLTTHGVKKDESKYIVNYYKYVKNPQKYASKVSSKLKKNGKKLKKTSRSFVRVTYKVKRGDNLKKIANLFKVSVRDIKKWNPRDTRKKYLQVGATLLIKARKLESYKARRGDTIGKICAKRKMKHSAFLKINNLRKKVIYKGRSYFVYK